jgi:ArsR family metal-binding transcriptional regulator
MLLHFYKITRTLPCLADPEKIRVIAEILDEIHEIFPYLNASLKGCIYNHPANTLTIRKDQKLITPPCSSLNGKLTTDSNHLSQRLHENDLIEIIPAPGG